jgi:UDP-N-acetylmuramoyl-tripeptide--D-alanyl-D-alanine ligase
MTRRRPDPPRTAAVSIALATWLAVLPGCAGVSSPADRAEPVPACQKLLAGPYTGPTDRLNAALVQRNALLARRFLLAIQKPAGNFIYELDFIKGRPEPTDNPVRQAGTTWALAYAHRYCPDAESLSALGRALDFWWSMSHDLGRGRLAPLYGDRIFGITGMLSLVILAHVEALRCELPEDLADEVRRKLDGYMKLLLDLRNPDGHFQSHYSKLGHSFGDPSPYYDGESLLAMTYAARHAGYARLRPKILASAEAMHQKWVVDAMADDPDHPDIKGFFHWGILSYYQIVQAGWDRRETFAGRAVDLAVWMVDVHKTLVRTRNTGYAYEGIVPAWDLAGRLGRTADRGKLDRTIRAGLYKLCTWQVGSPAANAELRARRPATDRALGGAMNRRFDPVLRNDTTQHQLHALLLAGRIYFGRSVPAPPTDAQEPSRRQSDPR